MPSHKVEKPCALAVPDDQGNEGFCTRYALSKAIVNGFQTKKFSGKELDFDQSIISSILVNEHKSNSGKWPSDFNGISFLAQEAGREWWQLNLTVSQIKKRTFQADLSHDNQEFEYVLVYQPQGSTENHTVFVNTFSSMEQKIVCINSHGTSNSYPMVDIRDVKKIYAVSCELEEPAPSPSPTNDKPKDWVMDPIFVNNLEEYRLAINNLLLGHGRNTFCGGCNFGPRTNSAVRKHCESIHVRILGGFRCPVCMKTIVSRIGFKTHVARCRK